MVDATDPTNLKFLTMDSVMGLAGIAVSGSNLYTATANGLSVTRSLAEISRAT